MPIDRILPETDGPFGIRNDQPLFPWESNQVIPSLAKALNIAECDVETQLDRNFRSLGKAIFERRKDEV